MERGSWRGQVSQPLLEEKGALGPALHPHFLEDGQGGLEESSHMLPLGRASPQESQSLLIVDNGSPSTSPAAADLHSRQAEAVLGLGYVAKQGCHSCHYRLVRHGLVGDD